jgi:Ca-activated chloride channel homolog
MKNFLAVAALLMGILGGVVNAQENGVGQSDDKIVTATNLVTINVIVTDNNGRYVKGLRAEDFEVYDANVLRPIIHFSNTAAPVSIGIVTEIHTSTSEKTRAMLTALKQFSQSLHASDDFFFLAYGTKGFLTSDFVPTYEQVLAQSMPLPKGNSAALYDAVVKASERLQRARNLKKALLIVSDGEDENSRQNYDAVRTKLKEFDVQVYAIGIANPAMDRVAGYGRWVFEDLTRETGRRPFLMNVEASMGRAVLAEMARVSGGASYFPESENEPELVGICSQISRELREQYTVGFYAAENRSKGDWHKVRIRLNGPQARRGLSLSYRQGYRRTQQ